MTALDVVAYPADTLAAIAHLLDAARPSWHLDAACRGTRPADWFPVETGARPRYVDLCAACPVADACADAGRGEHGGWWAGRPVGVDRARAARKARR